MLTLIDSAEQNIDKRNEILEINFSVQVVYYLVKSKHTC